MNQPKSDRLVAVYDYELFPYALGDVLTWNVQTARLCREVGREGVDVYICQDPAFPAGTRQRGFVDSRNCELFSSELFGAFATHPLLADTHIFRSRKSLLSHLEGVAVGDPVNTKVLQDYVNVLDKREDKATLKAYFIKYIHSHEKLNAFASRTGNIPLLVASRGCEPDVDGLFSTVFAGKRVIVIHPRLRRLDAGLGGDHTYSRDSDFLEWFDFVRLSEERYPDIRFVVTGRLQEKPLELLRRPNVTSIRAFGLGLGHELTLLMQADLFIGSSSGFAAMANFCEVPYFITHMNPESCHAYDIDQGADRLPFAAPNQFLVYERETSSMLLALLEQGLSLPERRPRRAAVTREPEIRVRGHERQRAKFLLPAASTCRFFTDDLEADQETAYLIWPTVQQALSAAEAGDRDGARHVARRAQENFPRLASRFGELGALIEGRGRSRAQRLKDSARQRLLRISGTVIPVFLRGTFLHRMARRTKNWVLGYDRR